MQVDHRYEPTPIKLKIASLDTVDYTVVEAQYNPRELSFDHAVPWQRREGYYQYGEQTTGRSLSIEMFFDAFERGDIQDDLDTLEMFANIIDPTSYREEKRRPHHCIVTWGVQSFEPFRCVIENLATKYTMFARDGRPLRATCSLKLREANLLHDEWIKLRKQGIRI